MSEQYFQMSKEKIMNWLEQSPYQKQYKVYPTYLKQGESRWRRGKKKKFQKSLVEDDLEYFAYIKFYLKDNQKFGIVAGKSGSEKVNKSAGCDLSFSTDPEHGTARKWLMEHKKDWCQTEFLVVRAKSEKQAFKIERELKKQFELLGS